MELSKINSQRSDPGQAANIRDTKSAAREFEALLIGQLLASAFTQEGGDSGAQTMMDFGKEHLARVIADGGGLGLGKLIETGIKR